MIRHDQQFSGDSGEFYVPKARAYFIFWTTTEPWALKHGLVHAIDVADSIRYGIVRKGVAYIAMDKDGYGNPVLERWSITKRSTYQESA